MKWRAILVNIFHDDAPLPMTRHRSHTSLIQLVNALRAHGYHFTTPTPATHARINARPGNEWGRDPRDVFGWSRPFRAGTIPDDLMAIMRDAGVLISETIGGQTCYRSAVRVSSLQDMLLLHSAYPTQAADAVFFGPDTYRYADAITTWLQAHERPILRAVDIGCGTGAGALLIARARPDAEVFGADINEAALHLTQVNAALAGTDRVAARHSDILSGVSGEFDLIVANPPYLADPAERAYRHGGGELGAALSLAIVAAALERLAVGGTLILYTGVAIVNGTDPFRQAVTECICNQNIQWRYKEIDPDVFSEELDAGPYVIADRIAAVVLTITMKV